MAGSASHAAKGPQAGSAVGRVLTFDGGIIELLPTAGYEVRFVPETPVIGFAFDAQQGVHSFASDRPRPFAARPNGLAYVPAGCEVMSRSAAGGEYLSVRGFSVATPGDNRRFSDLIDPAAVAAAHLLRRMMLRSATPDPLEVEAALASLFDVVDATHTCRRPQSGLSQRLTPPRLSRALDYIEAHLERPIMVRELAAILGLSVGYFSRAFKAATGRSAHSFILDRRLARARQLLQTGHAGLAEIALSCGFASHAHMSALFIRRYGAAPSALRDPAARGRARLRA